MPRVFLGDPRIWDRVPVALLRSQKVEVKCGEVFQPRVTDLHLSQIERFDIVTAFFTCVDAGGFFPLCAEIPQRLWILLPAIGADQSFDGPTVSTIRAEKRSFPGLFLKQTQGW